MEFEISIVISVSYEGLDDDRKVEMVLAHNENNNKNYNVVSNLESNDEVEDNFLSINLRMRLK